MIFQIAVKSCWRDKERGYHQVIRETWGKDLGDSLAFIVGLKGGIECNELADDEYILNCEDDYDHLPQKTQAIAKWFSTSYDHAYKSHVFLCDNDSFLIPERLKKINLLADYIGRFAPGPCEIGSTFSFSDARGEKHPKCHPWASGGVGYFLSRKAAGIIASNEPNTWAEDLWVGQLLGPLQQRGEIITVQPPQFECWAAWHWHRQRADSPLYTPDWMYEMQKKYEQGLI